MRFARNAKVFRGQLDMAPFASVFFLLLFFVVLAALIRTPGAPMRLSSVGDLLASPKERRIEVSRSGEIRFDGRTYSLDTLEGLSGRVKSLPRDAKLLRIYDPAAPRQLLSLIDKIARDSGLPLQNGDPIQLPDGSPAKGPPERFIVVAVDFAGQLYFNNQPIQEEAFQAEMSKAARAFPREPPPTLFLWADREVPFGSIARLTRLAREAGINNVRWAGRERKAAAARAKRSAGP